MTKHTLRIEPTFGQPSETAVQPQPAEPAAIAPTEDTAPSKPHPNAPKSVTPLRLSLHSTQSPGHTFTPFLTRPADIAQYNPTLEEQQMLKKQTSADNLPPNTTETPPRGFAFTPTHEDTDTPSQTTSTPEHSDAEVEKESITPEPLMERIIPVQPQTKKTDTPTKAAIYRRLALVGGILLALLLTFILLKPKAPETVEALQQGTTLPVEFRPVDEAEAKRAEEEAKALQQQAAAAAEEAARQAQLAQQQAQQQDQLNTQPTSTAITNELPSNPTVSATNALPTGVEVAQTDSSTEVTPPPSTLPSRQDSTTQNVTHTPTNRPSDNAATKPAISKAPISGSVIYQPEKPTVSKVAHVEKVVKAEKAHTTPNTTKAETKKEVKKVEPATANRQASHSSATTKVLVVKKGVTLFQNFRENGLESNLPELNKMTKLNGKTSELKPGQKITLRLDDQQRIVEMHIGSGKYLRQADGSYRYQ